VVLLDGLLIKHLFPVLIATGFPILRGFSALCNNFKFDDDYDDDDEVEFRNTNYNNNTINHNNYNNNTNNYNNNTNNNNNNSRSTDSSNARDISQNTIPTPTTSSNNNNNNSNDNTTYNNFNNSRRIGQSSKIIKQQYLSYFRSLDLIHIKSELFNKMDELERPENIEKMCVSVFPEIFVRLVRDENDNRQENKSLVSKKL
jgi:hypothetical protein